MQLTKHVHACVTLEEGASRLLLDPGTFTPDAADQVAATAAVLITHEHPDHFNEAVLAEAISDRPELTVYGPEAVVGRWEGRPGQVVAVAPGDRLQVQGLEVTVHGGTHAEIHPDIPRVANVGYLVADAVFHPGDAYQAPPAPVKVMLMPTSGPWAVTTLAVDLLRRIEAEQVVQIHEAMLSEVGQQSMARFLGPEMLGTKPVSILPPGTTIDV